MFERFSEPAARVLFFARYEASHDHSAAIATEHLLVGLLREPTTLAGMLIRDHGLSIEVVRDEAARVSSVPRDASAAVEIPFAPDVVRMLQSASEAADQLGHPDVRTIHLLLGVLDVPDCLAALMLARAGLQAETVLRAAQHDTTEEPALGTITPSGEVPGFDGENTLTDG